MKTFKRIVLSTVLAAGTGVALVANSFADTPNYVPLLKKDIENGGCYSLTLSGSAIGTETQNGQGPTKTYSFLGKGMLNANKSLNAKMKVKYFNRPNANADNQTIWFSTRKDEPVGGIIVHSMNNQKIDFERLRLKKMHLGWVLNAESHTGDYNATSYSMVINKESC